MRNNPAAVEHEGRLIYADTYQITLSSMGMYLLEGEDRRQLSAKFDVGLSCRMITNLEECRRAYGMKFSCPMELSMSISHLVARLSQSQYQFLMTVLNSNVSRDDGKGQFFSSQRTQVQAAEQEAGEIRFGLEAGLVGFIASEEDGLPFAFLRIEDLGVQWQGSSEGMDTTVTLFRLEGSYYQPLDGGQDRYQEHGLIGNLARSGSYSRQQASEMDIFVEQVKGTARPPCDKDYDVRLAHKVSRPSSRTLVVVDSNQLSVKL